MSDDELNALFAEKVCGWVVCRDPEPPMCYVAEAGWLDIPNFVEFVNEVIAATPAEQQRLEFAHVYNRELAAEVIALQSRNETLRRALEDADFAMHCVAKVSAAHAELVAHCYDQELTDKALAATPAEQPANTTET